MFYRKKNVLIDFLITDFTVIYHSHEKENQITVGRKPKACFLFFRVTSGTKQR